jgi:phage terminase large subunit-like protein
VQIFQDRLYMPHHDGTMLVLPADAAALQGFDPTLLVVDELGVVKAETWEAASLAAGKRDESLTLAISTPGDTRDSVMWDLVEHGRTGADPSFGFVEYASPEGGEVDDESAWAVGNPALGDFLSLDAMRSVRKTTREGPFRRFRLGQWVGRTESWLPWGLFESRADHDREVGRGARIVAGFDGSVSGDSTALIGATVETDPFVFVVDVWESNERGWRVSRADVHRTVEAMFATYDVRELACDPWHWRTEIESWAERYGSRRVIEWPTNVVQRMGPATDAFYAGLVEGRLSHDGDGRLCRHVRNAVAKTSTFGDVVVKDARNSPRKIDAAVAAIVAYDRALYHSRSKRRGRLVAV